MQLITQVGMVEFQVKFVLQEQVAGPNRINAPVILVQLTQQMPSVLFQ